MPEKQSDPTPVGILDALARICGHENISTRQSDRVACSRDMWPRSLIRPGTGFFERLADVIVWPKDANQVARVVRFATKAKLPIVPYGAGSGVCGGTLPVKGGLLVDLKRLCRITRLHEQDSLLEVEVGIVGENLERELNRLGWTLGHFPSSMYCSTVGGWIAARGAGQCSSRYGKIEDLVRSVCFVDSGGTIRTTPLLPPGYSSWSLDSLLTGSEGTLGILVSAALVIRPLPKARWFRGFRFKNLESGLEAMRWMLRRGCRPSVLRLYDEFDTVLSSSGADMDGVKESLLKNVAEIMFKPIKGIARLSLRRLLFMPGLLNRLANHIPSGCLLVVVHEGDSTENEFAGGKIVSLCSELGGVDLGEIPGRHWWSRRYSTSYKQAPLFMAGAFVDTMEVATTWDGLLGLYQSVRRAVSGLTFVMAHFSHAYREGCSVYFTFVGAASDHQAALELYDRIWDAAQGAVLAQGATVSHHHGIGLSKQAYLEKQLQDAGVIAHAVKKAFDPKGLYNPGKLDFSSCGT